MSQTPPDVPGAIGLFAKVAQWMRSSKKTGGLGYSEARMRSTNLYKGLLALGATAAVATGTTAVLDPPIFIGTSPPAVTVLHSTSLPTVTTFVAQSSAGSNNGSSCANAHSASFFNTSGNWGSGQTFAPDTVVGLCGSFTTDLDVPGDGTSGHPVTVEPAAGQGNNLTLGFIGVNGHSFVTVNGNHQYTTKGVNVDYEGFGSTPSHDTIENLHITNVTSPDGGAMHVWDGQNITISGNVIGPECCNADAVDIAIRNGGDPNNSNIVFTDNLVHEIYDTCTEVPDSVAGCTGLGFGDAGGSSAQHVDGMQVYGADGLDVERNQFYLEGDERQGIFVQAANGGTFSNLLFANNMISATTDNAFSISGTGDSAGVNSVTGYVKILYNTILGAAYLYNGVVQSGTPVVFAGNIIGGFAGNQSGGGCTMTYGNGSSFTPTWRNNLLISNTACDATDHGSGTATATLVHQTGTPGGRTCTNADGSGCHLLTGDADLHLLGAQMAINGGESTYCPALDVDSQSRPIGAACDIGADEAG